MNAPAPAPAPEAALAPQVQPTPDLGGDDDFSSLREAIRSAPEAGANKPQEQPKKAEKQVEKPVEKPDKAQEQPKSLKDKLKVEDEPVEEENPENTDEVDDDEIPKYKDRVPTEKEKATWKGLKQVKAEYEKLKPEFEKLKAEYEEFKKKPVFDEEVTKELEELRRFRDMQDFRQSETYMKEVAEPLSAIESDVTEMVTEFKLDKDSLAKAFTEKSEWKRNLAIDKVLREADEEVPGGVAQAIRDKASELHNIWKKEADLAFEAEKNRAAYEHEKGQKVTKQTLEEQKAWTAALEASTQMVETQMGPLLKALPEDQRNELMSALKDAKIADTPEDRALQAQAPHIAAVLIERLNAVTKEMAALKKANKALSAASPVTQGRKPDVKKPADEDDDGESLIRDIRASQGW